MKKYYLIRFSLLALLTTVTCVVVFLLFQPPYSVTFWLLFGFGIWSELFICFLPLNFQDEYIAVKITVLGISACIYAIGVLCLTLIGVFPIPSKLLISLELLLLLIPGVGFCVCAFFLHTMSGATQRLISKRKTYEKWLSQVSRITVEAAQTDPVEWSEFQKMWDAFAKKMPYITAETYPKTEEISVEIGNYLSSLEMAIKEKSLQNAMQCFTKIKVHIEERERLSKNGN